jgi:hypothetical protein
MWAADSLPISSCPLPMRTAVGDDDVLGRRRSVSRCIPKNSAVPASPPKAGASGCILGFIRLFCALITRARRERAQAPP